MTDALLVSSSFLPGRGGIESYLAELCLELSPRLAVFAPARRDGKPLPADLPHSTIGYDGTLYIPHRRVAAAIVSAAEEVGTDRVIFGTPWPLALLGPRLRRAGLSYASIVHGAEFLTPAMVPIVRPKLADALAGADLLLPVSRFTKMRLERWLGSSRPPHVEVLRARVDAERYHPQVDSSAVYARFGLTDRRVVLAFGRLVRRKGVHRLIKMLPRILASCPDACLVVGGTGPEENRLRRLGAQHGDRVIFTGRVPQEDAAALYAAADVFAFPVVDRWWGLDTEGLGVVLLEASACGTPCVSGRSGGTPEAVVDGETGRVVDARNEDLLADAIVSLLRDRELAGRMGAAARDHVVSEFAERALPAPLLEWLAGA